MVKIFDVQNKQVVPTEFCYTSKTLRRVMEELPDTYLKVYQYAFYMTCPNSDLNAYFDVPEDDKEELIIKELEIDFSLDEDIIVECVDFCKKLYQTPTYRAYLGIKNFLDNLADYMATTKLEHGRDGNITSGVNAAAKFESIRQSYKGALKDMEEEQKSTVRGGKSLAYDN